MRDYLKEKLYKSLYNNAYSRSFYTLLGVVIREMQCSFQQFFTWKYPIRSFLRVFGILCSTIIRLFLGRSLKYSFAFTGEDRIIEGILKPIVNKKGFYVDIGCNHPKFFSNTYGLYKKGWTGICIDGNTELIRKYKLYRPKDIAVNAIVSNNTRETNFYEIENNVLSTIVKSNLDEAVNLGLSYKTINIKTRTLSSILREYKIQNDFDILSIDAEEHDFEILNSLDFRIYSPKLIIVEDETFDFESYSDNNIVNYLTEKGYRMVGYVLKNAYFIKKRS